MAAGALSLDQTAPEDGRVQKAGDPLNPPREATLSRDRLVAERDSLRPKPTRLTGRANVVTR